MHVGMHRTGSTFLQKTVFPRLDVDCLVKPDVEYLLYSDQFDPVRMRRELEAALPDERRARLVISQQTLGGRPEVNPSDWPDEGIRRLASTFPGCHVILVLRNQWSYLESMYAYRVMSRGLEFRSFSGYLADKLEDDLIRTLRYDALVDAYRAAFGESRVLILLYEKLARDPEWFLQRLCRFIGVEPPAVESGSRPNMTSRSALMLSTHRVFNVPGRLTRNAIAHVPGGRALANELARTYGKIKERAFDAMLRNVAVARRAKLAVHPAIKDRIDREIGPGNRRLGNAIGEPLSDLGYLVA